MSTKTNGHGLEAIAVRRAKVADAGKVRYRVYTTESEFIAVIAESALMAVKVAGVEEPVRIVRDLPTEGVALEAERIAKQEAIEKVQLATVPKAATRFNTEAPVKPSEPNFVPVKLRDLQPHSALRQSIIPADMLRKIIAESPKPAAVVPSPPPTPDPIAVKAEPEAPPAPPEPPAAEAPPAPVPSANGELSPDEVQKLLNG